MLANLIAGRENSQIDEVRRSARVLRAGQPKFRQPEIQGAWAAETVSGAADLFCRERRCGFLLCRKRRKNIDNQTVAVRRWKPAAMSGAAGVGLVLSQRTTAAPSCCTRLFLTADV